MFENGTETERKSKNDKSPNTVSEHFHSVKGALMRIHCRERDASCDDMTDATLFDIVLGGPANFDYEVGRAWTSQRRHVALAIVPTYLVSLFALKHTMKDRKAYSLQADLRSTTLSLIHSCRDRWSCGTAVSPCFLWPVSISADVRRLKRTKRWDLKVQAMY